MKTITRLTLILLLLPLVLFNQACPTTDSKAGAVRGLAITTAGLDAWAKALDVARKYDDIDSSSFRSQIVFIEHSRSLTDQVVAKVELGFDKADALGKLDEILVEIQKAEDNLGIRNEDSKARFKAILGFARFGVQTARNFVLRLKPPAPPVPAEVERALRGSGSRRSATGDNLAKIAEYVTVAQEFAFRTIGFVQGDYFGNLIEQKKLSTTLGVDNAARLLRS